jgi:hypothetical protein
VLNKSRIILQCLHFDHLVDKYYLMSGLEELRSKPYELIHAVCISAG